MLNFQLFISTISDTAVILPTLILLGCILFHFNQKKHFYEIVFSSMIATCITFFLKYYFNIPRPVDMLVTETSPRFPSGHATIAGVVATLICYFTYAKIKNKYLRLIIYLLSFSWILLVSYSRIYLHAHYLIDVAVGSLIGIITTAIVLKIFKHLHLL